MSSGWQWKYLGFFSEGNRSGEPRIHSDAMLIASTSTPSLSIAVRCCSIISLSIAVRYSIIDRHFRIVFLLGQDFRPSQSWPWSSWPVATTSKLRGSELFPWRCLARRADDLWKWTEDAMYFCSGYLWSLHEYCFALLRFLVNGDLQRQAIERGTIFQT